MQGIFREISYHNCPIIEQIFLLRREEQVKGRLVEISGKAFDWRAEELLDQLKTIILHAGKEDKTEFQTRQMNGVGKIEVNEYGIITKIENKATYYFGDLNSDGGLPDNASDRKDKNIGNKITNLKGKVQYTGGAYYSHDLTSWRNLTKDILSDDILPKETKKN